MPVNFDLAKKTNVGELYYPRLLLTVVPGANSFDKLKTLRDGDGRKLHCMFKGACIVLGILEDENEWSKCSREAPVMKTGVQLRKLGDGDDRTTS